MDHLITNNNGNQLLNYPTLLKTQQQNITSTPLLPPQVNPSLMHSSSNSSSSSSSDFPIAISLLALVALALLLASYYIFVIKCCLNWQNLDPLRRFSISRARENDINDDSLISFYSSPVDPVVNGVHRGLDEWLINNIPAFHYRSGEASTSWMSSKGSNKDSFRGCAVCLNEFNEGEILRILPKCRHNFHLDCIDLWLMKNASCPLCRSNISGRTTYPIHQIIAPNSSPTTTTQDKINEQEFLVIELSQVEDDEEEEVRNRNVKKNSRKLQRRSMMGDECINVRRKDEQFEVQQPIRRSISMDSAVDRGLLYLQVREILRQNNEIIIVSNNNNNNNDNNDNNVNESNGSNNKVIRRSSFFSFGHGRSGSRSSSSILPLSCEL